MCKEGKANLNNMAMLTLSRTILLVCMRARNMMGDTNFLKETIKFFILTTPISLHSDNFPIKLTLNKGLKVEKNLINIRTVLKQINPCKFTEIINEAYII